MNFRSFIPTGSLAALRLGPLAQTVFELAAGIKTYTEQVDALESLAQISSEVARAECIVFLGFAYHSQNIAILQPPEPIRLKQIYGTAYNISDADVEVVSNRLGSFFTPTPNRTQRMALFRLENKLTSAELFDHYARSLSGGD